jgi:hypothetical protein
LCRDAGKSMVHYQGIEWSRIMRHIWKRGEQEEVGRQLPRSVDSIMLLD